MTPMLWDKTISRHWPTRTPSMSYRERETFKEVAEQYELTQTQAARAVTELAALAWKLPFRVYTLAHMVCAEAERNLDTESRSA